MIPTINHFVGQPQVIEPFRVALEATWSSGMRMPHILLTGPAGTGKTTLAKLAAAETGSVLHERLGQVLSSPMTVNALLIEAQDKEVIFIDEIHEMLPSSQVLLYRAMEDRKIFLQGRGNKTHALPVNDFVLVAATTDAYGILPPLRDRFGLILDFEWYGMDTLETIVKDRAKLEGVEIAEGIARRIATRGRGTPRLAIRLLHACQRLAASLGEQRICQEHFEKTVLLEGLDSLGLDRIQQRFLRLLESRKKKVVRLFDLEASLGVHRRSLQQIVEPFLLVCNLIERTPQGRRITPEGIKHVKVDNEMRIQAAE